METSPGIVLGILIVLNRCLWSFYDKNKDSLDITYAIAGIKHVDNAQPPVIDDLEPSEQESQPKNDPAQLEVYEIVLAGKDQLEGKLFTWKPGLHTNRTAVLLFSRRTKDIVLLRRKPETENMRKAHIESVEARDFLYFTETYGRDPQSVCKVEEAMCSISLKGSKFWLAPSILARSRRLKKFNRIASRRRATKVWSWRQKRL